jgi:thioesterase domain-containing protein
MADRFVSELLEFQPVGPYHIVGLCHGGVVAVEMARRLRSLRHEVRTLALVNLAPLEPFVDYGWGVDDIARYRLESIYARFQLKSVVDLPRVFRDMRSDRWYDDDIGPEEVMRLQVLWAALAYSLHHYEPRPYDGPVTLLQPSCTASAVEKYWEPALPQATIHWFDDFGERLLPIMRDPKVAELISASLARETC